AAILSLPSGLYRHARLFLGDDDSLSALTKAPDFYVSRMRKSFLLRRRCFMQNRSRSSNIS
ncbi:hypothetical protein, partial [Agrobacterium tumefaciens]|uniref:hypothetical protein n=1 Tax=Agrobacterium tumefaciens TaxID=358 RepID=UPI001AE3D143